MANHFTIGLSGLRAASRGIATTSHNIANVGTEGYTRQRNIDVTRLPQLTNSGYEGTGVRTDSIQRVNDSYISSQLQSQRSELGRISTFSSQAQQLEKLLAGSGLNTAQSDFFNALEDAANNPHSIAQANQVIATAGNMASQFNYIGTQLDGMRRDINDKIDAEISEINTLSESIYLLNQQISSVHTHDNPPNDLLDQRDQLLENLSQHVNTNVVTHGDYGIDVSTGNGVPLVTLSGSHHLTSMPGSADPNTRVVAMTTADGDRLIPISLNGGAIGALLDFQTDLLEPTRLDLGRSATVLGENINTALQSALALPEAKLFTLDPITVYNNEHNTGSGSTTVTLVDTTLLGSSEYRLQYDGAVNTLTRLSDGKSIQGAGTLSMDGLQFSLTEGADTGDSYLIKPTANAAASISTYELEASELTALQSGDSPQPVVQALADLRNTRIFDSESATLADQNANLLIRVGSSVRTATNQQESMQQIFNDTAARRESVSGVSLDEEAAALMMYQRNYDASAKAIAISNTMFDTLIAALNRI